MMAAPKPSGSPLAQEIGVVLGSIVDDFVERVWGFLSVKEGLRSRLRSQTSKEREDYIQQATNLSLTYNFLTPLTKMVVENPEVLADGTMAPAPSVVPPVSGADSTANELPGDTEDTNTEKLNERPGGQTSSLSNTIGEVLSSRFGSTGNLNSLLPKLK